MPTPAPAAPVPFWNRLRDIALYPFRGTAVFMVLLLTGGTLLGMAPGLGWIVSALVWFAGYKYSFEILRASADGELESPQTGLSIGDSVVWKFILLQLVFVFIAALAFGLGGLAIGLLVTVALVFLQPGCLMSLAIDGSFGRAIDPTTPIAVVSRIGWPYFAAFGMLLVIQATAGTAGAWLGDALPPVFGELALNFFTFWGLFATFHLMGYLVYQYHEVLGYEPDSISRALPARFNRDQQLLDAAEARIREGDNAGALQGLREEIRSRAVDAEVHELYRRLLRQQGVARDTEEHALVYLNLLMIEKQERKALGLLREALDANPDFVPMQAEHGEQLATRARLSGQAQLAHDQWRALLRRHPNAANAPRWGLDAALVLSERGRDDEARSLLEQARARCDDASLRDKIEAALKPLAA